MKTPHTGGMGTQGHDQSVIEAAPLVHNPPTQCSVPKALPMSQWLWFRLLFGQQEGWFYGTMLHNGPKEDRWLPYPFNTDEEDGEPVLFHDDKNAYFGLALRSIPKEISSEKQTSLIWFDCDLKVLAVDRTASSEEQKVQRKAEDERLKQLPCTELWEFVASVYLQFIAKCLALGMEPTYTLYSGHGFQGAFRAKNPLQHDETEAANRAIAKRFTEFGADLAVANIGRILRVPNTYNLKNSARPVRTELWHHSDALLSDELVAELIEEGRAIKAPPIEHEVVPKKPLKPTTQEGGLIDWYNSQTLIDQYLLGRGYKHEGDDRMSSPYSETGRDVRFLANQKGVRCAYLHSSSHPMALWLGLDGEALSKHLIDPFDFLVYYEHSDGGEVAYEEARKAALQSIARERDAELIAQTLEQQTEQVTLPDAESIPNPLQPNKDKLDYSDEQAVKLLELPVHLSVPDDDLAFAARLVRQTEGNLCYVPERGFLAYNEETHVWADGDTAKQLSLKYAASLPQVVSREVSSLLAYALACQRAGQDQKSSALLRLVQRMESVKGKKGIGSRVWRERAVADASTLVLVSNERFHAKPFVLGFPNCVYDNGSVREHYREDYFTELLPVEYHPEADQGDWLSVLERITGGDTGFKSNLQYAVGYALSGLSNQRLIFSLRGPKGTGKSLFTETMLAVAGGLGATVPPELLSVGSKRGALGAVLYNKRFAIIPEVGGTRRLESEIVKTVSSGGDSLPVEFKYKQPFTARPTHTAFMVSNDPPNIDTTDDALWERIKDLPFVHPLAPEGKEDLLGGKHLQDVMRDPASAYLRGFLAWAMEGLERVRSGELFTALEAVAKASVALRIESDPYREFWLEQGIAVFRDGVSAGWLKSELQYWCDSNSVYMPKGRAMKATYEAVGLLRSESAKKWFLEYPERFPV